MAFGFFRGREGEDFGPPPPPFRIRRRSFEFSRFGGVNRWVIGGVALVLLYIVLSIAKSFFVNWLWFDGAGYRSVYSKMLTTRIWLFFGGAGVFLAFFGANVFYASRSALRAVPSGLGEIDAAALRRLYLLAVIAASIFLAIIFGSIASSKWDTVLQFLNKQPFGVEDPQFHRDVSFFVFTQPALKVFQGWMMGTAILTTLVVAGLYLARFLLSGPPAREDRSTKVHLSLLLIAIVGLFVWRYWLDIFDLDFSTNGVVFGATYTDINARIPLTYVAMAMGGVTAATLVAGMFRRGAALPIAAMIIWIAFAFLGRVIYPSTVQRFTVQPNEREKERPYIERNIEMTRRAFGLDQIKEEDYAANPEVTKQEKDANPETIQNMRLLDATHRSDGSLPPLLQTYAQIQTIRPLYEFLDVDVDRYDIDGVQRQVMLSARELNSSRLPPEAQGWVNRRLQFTHGYGVVMSPVNEVVKDGLPDLFLQGIPVSGKLQISQPAIYYGEEPDNYVIVKTKEQEFDHPCGPAEPGCPAGGGNVQTTFEGGGGVQIGSLFRRIVFAWEFKDVNIAISGSLTSDSRILFRRNIAERVRTIAPFLTLDRDPYLVIADGHLFWIQDAYTTTSRYPYSKPAPNGVNYIRNSVKVVVDAYDGTTTFYQVDPNDPIIKTYAKIFPDLLTPIDKMPASLRAHLRYPEDLFLTQVNQYLTYHIKDADGLYKKEDIWTVPTELFSGSSGVSVQPYYVIMRIPREAAAEFALILPLTPARRSNTIAWVAARSDGANYGKLLAFHFPTESSVYGPRQVESLIDQDTTVSAQFSLWNQSGSRVIRGNLLMIPIGQGNLFVEPIYLRSETSQLPQLKRVVVVNGSKVAMETTLNEALKVIFEGAAPTAPGLTPGEAPSGLSPPPTTTPGTTTPTQTPRPTATAAPAGTPTTIGQLALQADAAYQRAQDALKRGDFAAYGTEIARVQELIQQIVRQSGGP